MNLQNYSFGQLYKNLPVREVQRRCREVRGADEICENPDNWRQYVQETYGRKYLAERGDLVTAEDWIDFARGMEQGYTFRYTAYIVRDDRVGNLVEGNRVGDDNLPGGQQYWQPSTFTLQGTFLRPGPTVHYFVEILIYYNNLLPEQDNVAELASRIFASQALVTEWLTEYLQVKVFNDPELVKIIPTQLEVTVNGQLAGVESVITDTADPLRVIQTYTTTPQPKLHYMDIFFDRDEADADLTHGVTLLWYPVVKRDY